MEKVNEQRLSEAQDYLDFRKKDEENTQIDLDDTEKKYSDSDLFFYIQVIVRLLKKEPDTKLIDEILKNGANINYLTEYNENVLFKVSI